MAQSSMANGLTSDELQAPATANGSVGQAYVDALERPGREEGEEEEEEEASQEAIEAAVKRSELGRRAHELRVRLALASFKASRGWEGLDLGAVDQKYFSEPSATLQSQSPDINGTGRVGASGHDRHLDGSFCSSSLTSGGPGMHTFTTATSSASSFMSFASSGRGGGLGGSWQHYQRASSARSTATTRTTRPPPVVSGRSSTVKDASGHGVPASARRGASAEDEDKAAASALASLLNGASNKRHRGSPSHPPSTPPRGSGPKRHRTMVTPGREGDGHGTFATPLTPRRYGAHTAYPGSAKRGLPTGAASASAPELTDEPSTHIGPVTFDRLPPSATRGEQPSNGGGSRAVDDDEGARLMLYLATSPSPARVRRTPGDSSFRSVTSASGSFARGGSGGRHRPHPDSIDEDGERGVSAADWEATPRKLFASEKGQSHGQQLVHGVKRDMRDGLGPASETLRHSAREASAGSSTEVASGDDEPARVANSRAGIGLAPPADVDGDMRTSAVGSSAVNGDDLLPPGPYAPASPDSSQRPRPLNGDGGTPTRCIYADNVRPPAPGEVDGQDGSCSAKRPHTDAGVDADVGEQRRGRDKGGVSDEGDAGSVAEGIDGLDFVKV